MKHVNASMCSPFWSVFNLFPKLVVCNVDLYVTAIETQRIGNSHLRKVSVSESNVLLDEEVLTDPKIQALLLTVLVSIQIQCV